MQDVQKKFYEASELRGVFLDISKLFDVWYEKLLFKLKQKGISSKILFFFTDVLSNRNQRAALNGQILFIEMCYS